MKRMSQISMIAISILLLGTSALWAGNVHDNTMFNQEEIAYLEGKDTTPAAPVQKKAKTGNRFRNTMFNDDTKEFLASESGKDNTVDSESAVASTPVSSSRNTMFNADTTAYLNDSTDTGITAANPIHYISGKIGSIFQTEPQN